MAENRKWKKLLSEGEVEYEYDIFKWNEITDSLEGVWKGTTDGKYGQLGLVESSDDGRLKGFEMHKVLESKLGTLAPGTSVRIEWLGKKMGKSGFAYHTFNVYTEDPD